MHSLITVWCFLLVPTGICMNVAASAQQLCMLFLHDKHAHDELASAQHMQLTQCLCMIMSPSFMCIHCYAAELLQLMLFMSPEDVPLWP